ncbi:MAG TPA: hypothetical protein VNA21_11075, partial [Steroidobacteraceae bacterium]|nr:hypothetical protein [Steroidobacteraceae bacterium]
RESPTQLALLVSDNGSGFEAGRQEPGGLGKSLIDAFVRQLHGELEVKSEQGTQVTVRFPSSFQPPEQKAAESAAHKQA